MSFVKSSLCPTHNSAKGCPCRQLTIFASIFTAAELGDAQRVSSLIKGPRKVRPDTCDPFGYTALHFAAQHNRVDVIKVLIAAGASPDGVSVKKGGCGATPLHRAAYSGSEAAVYALIAAGADPNAKDLSFGDQRTPLHKAVSQRHSNIVRILLDAGADASILDREGIAALAYERLEAENDDQRNQLTATTKSKRIATSAEEKKNNPTEVEVGSEVQVDALAQLPIPPSSIEAPGVSKIIHSGRGSAGIACSMCGVKCVVIEKLACCDAPACKKCAAQERRKRWTDADSACDKCASIRCETDTPLEPAHEEMAVEVGNEL